MKRREWAEAVFERARQVGPVPRYGDEVWCRLEPGDARFVAAVVLAAECWHEDPDETQDRLALEVAAMRDERERYEAAEFAAMAQRLRSMANSPTHEELQRRRAGGAE